MTDSDAAYVLCLRCGRPAATGPLGQGEHHEPPIGMGGSSLPDIDERTVPLCRRCHRQRHDGKLLIRKDDQVITFLTPDGEVLSSRPLVPAQDIRALGPGETDFRKLRNLFWAYHDEALAYVWEEAEHHAAHGFVLQCFVALELKDRYGQYGQGFWKRGAEILECSTDTLYERVRQGDYLATVEEPVQEVRRMGRLLTAALGGLLQNGTQPEAVAETAAAIDAEISEGKTTRTAAAQRLRDPDKPPRCETTSVHVCKYCGMELEP